MVNATTSATYQVEDEMTLQNCLLAIEFCCDVLALGSEEKRAQLLFGIEIA
jgi:hypothetical protein